MFEFINSEKVDRLDYLFGHLYGGSEIHIPKREVLYRDGDQCHSVYLIKTGEIELFKKDENQNYFFLSSKKTGVLGVSSLFITSKYSHTAITGADSVLYQIPSPEFKTLIMNNLHLHKEILLPIAMDINLYEKRVQSNF